MGRNFCTPFFSTSPHSDWSLVKWIFKTQTTQASIRLTHVCVTALQCKSKEGHHNAVGTSSSRHNPMQLNYRFESWNRIGEANWMRFSHPIVGLALGTGTQLDQPLWQFQVDFQLPLCRPWLCESAEHFLYLYCSHLLVNSWTQEQLALPLQKANLTSEPDIQSVGGISAMKNKSLLWISGPATQPVKAPSRVCLQPAQLFDLLTYSESFEITIMKGFLNVLNGYHSTDWTQY